jgi:hypothetical protein
MLKQDTIGREISLRDKTSLPSLEHKCDTRDYSVILTYPHTMCLVHIDPDWSIDTKISHVLERTADVHLTAWH